MSERAYTDEEIIARAEECIDRGDKFKNELHEYTSCLPADAGFLRADTTPDQLDEWTRLVYTEPTKENMLQKIQQAMPYAWEYANNQEDKKVKRLLQRFIAWAWLCGEEELSNSLAHCIALTYGPVSGIVSLVPCYETYRFYGKPQLTAISNKFGIEWQKYDNDEWRDPEVSKTYTATKVLNDIALIALANDDPDTD